MRWKWAPVRHWPVRHWSVARQLLVLQAVVVGLLVVAGTVPAYVDAQDAAGDRARETVSAVAATVADAPSVRAALAAPEPSRSLQPFAERVRADTGVDFITIMNPAGIRYTHPDPARIGQRFIGNTAPALAGRPFTETYTGTLGPSVRAVVPVFEGKRVVGLVAVGITVRAITSELRGRLLWLAAIAVAVLAAGIAGSYLVSARLRRQTRGVAPDELRHMFDYYEAILHAVREGLVILDRDGRVVLCNDAARELLDLDPGADPAGTPIDALGLPPGLAEALVSAETRSDEIHVSDTRVLVVNTVPVRSRGRAMGTVATLRDHTDLQALMGELDTVRGFAEALRAQAHEAANRLHTVVSLVELGRTEQAVDFATAELATAQALTDRVVGAVSEPVLAALLLGKSAEAAERGVELRITEDTAIDDTHGAIDPRDLVTVLGNLIDNAVDAAMAGDGPPRVEVSARTMDTELVLRVADTGPGIDPELVPAAFRRGWTTKPPDGPVGHGLGLALVGRAVRRYGGDITVERDVGAVVTVSLPIQALPVQALPVGRPDGDS
ncbi:sensor histidine kinase [Actinomadura rudentiformis]|uniref:histidine kinase n=1 Tax=Actinomadura rudentiformis TaxID=359158 RepID=A0A6H9YWC0_9ACTN|nr:sensor histidine kinase [Actinomadura rudentiformis]KAB2346039.1 sensor histidine kinase [Actinomadura rudentiformis]